MYGSLSAPGDRSAARACLGRVEFADVHDRRRRRLDPLFPPGETVELCRHRVSQAGPSLDIEDPAAGFLTWLEAAK